MRAVVIYSGGMDSTTLLHHAVREYGAPDVLAVSFDYGQRHGERELRCAVDNCVRLQCKQLTLDLQALEPVFGGALVDKAQQVPEGHYADESMKQTVVPGRNLIMISLASALAIKHEAAVLLIGAHSGDHPIYPDCRPEFIENANAAVQAGNWDAPRLLAPFIHKDKAEIVRLGAARLGVDYRHTWSCYKGGSLHCGKCGTCVERKEAFKLAQVADPTEYEE